MKRFLLLIYFLSLNCSAPSWHTIEEHLTKYGFCQAALIIIDMWDTHWCKTMACEGDLLAERINKFAKVFRSAGGTVIHCYYLNSTCSPLDEQYKQLIKKLGYEKLCGCKCGHNACGAFLNKILWHTHNPRIVIEKQDFNLRTYDELAKIEGIEVLFLVGQHINECLLHRPIGALSLLQNDRQFCIIQDLTNDSFCYECPQKIRKSFYDWVATNVCPMVKSNTILRFWALRDISFFLESW